MLRNCIIKKKLGIEANNTNLNNLKLKNLMMINYEKKWRSWKIKKKSIESSINIKIKVGEGDRVFGSISSKEISKREIKNQLGFDMNKRKLCLRIQLRD